MTPKPAPLPTHKQLAAAQAVLERVAAHPDTMKHLPGQFARASLYEAARALGELQRREDVRALPNGHERGYRDHERTQTRTQTARGHGWKP